MIEKLREIVDALVDFGKSNYVKNDKEDYLNSEYFQVYSLAVDLLIRNYNTDNAQGIEKIFEDKIPMLYDNKLCEDVPVEFKNFFSTDNKIRVKTSRYFRQIALGSNIDFPKIIFQRPSFVKKLIAILEHETDTKVIVNLIITLGAVYRIFFKFYDMFTVLKPFIQHKKVEVRYYAIIWSNGTNKNERRQLLKDQLKKEKSEKVKELIKRELTY